MLLLLWHHTWSTDDTQTHLYLSTIRQQLIGETEMRNYAAATSDLFQNKYNHNGILYAIYAAC